MKDDWNAPAWLAPNNRYITAGYGYQFIVMAANARDSKWTPLYPKRKWAGLTDEDISKAKTLLKDNDPDYAIFFIMTRLQEYNT